MSAKATVLAAALSIALAAPAAQAQIPVTDVASITQRAMESAQQLAQLVNQLEQMKAQLEQARAQYEAMTGSRGMGSLLSGQNYQRIPTNWKETLNMINGSDGRYGNISSMANQVLHTMNGIDPNVFAEVDSSYGQLSGESANQAATYQALQGTEYNDTAARFDELKQLIAKIDQAPDEKAILDLNARIGAQQVMLQNEQLKMQALAQLRESQKDLQAAKAQQAWIQNSHSHAPSLGAPVTSLETQ